MSNDKFRYGGAGFLGDLVRQGGDVYAHLRNEQDIKDKGAGMWADLARNGGDIIVDHDAQPEGGSFVTPTHDWRVQILTANTADSTWNTALQSQHTAKTLPLKTAVVSASTTYTMYLQLAAIAAPGGMLFMDYIHSGTNAVTWDFDESFGASSTGSDLVDYAEIPFTPWRPSGATSNSSFSGVGQCIPLAAGASRWVRVTITTPSGTTAQPYFGAFQFKSDRSEPFFAMCSMSIGTINVPTLNGRAAIMEAIPGSDPIWINMARSGANSDAIKSEQVDVLVAGGPNSQYGRVNAVCIDLGINDLAYSTRRPYSGDPLTDLASDWQQNVTPLVAKFGVRNVYITNVSFGNFTSADMTSNAEPYVDGDVASANGFLPYNLNVYEPLIKAQSAVSWSSVEDGPMVNDYVGDASDFENYHTDSLHHGTFGAREWRDRRYPFFRQMYGLSVDKTTLDRLLSQVGTGATSTMKSRMQAVFDTMAVSAVPFRTTVQDKITSIVTSYSEPSVTSPAILPVNAATAPIFHIDAGRFDKVTRSWNGFVSELKDTISDQSFTQGTANTTVRPRLAPRQFDGTPAVLRFNSGATPYLTGTPANTVGALDTVNQAYTVYAVVSLDAAITAGCAWFGIANASLNFLIVGHDTNSSAPRFYVGDGTGGAFYTTGDTTFPLLTRVAFCFRNDGTGASNGLKYNRNGVSTQGTSAKVAAKTGTAASIGRRAYIGGDYPIGGLHELSLHKAYSSDSEVANVLAGLREKWGAS